MTDQIREQLSALLDGELPRDEIGPARAPARPGPAAAADVRRLRTDRRDAARPRRPRRERRVCRPRECGDRTLASSRARSRRQSRLRPSCRLAFWKRPVVRTALAASAAATAVLLFRPDAGHRRRSPSWRRSAWSRRPSYSPTPAQAQRLASYMVAHSQYSTPMVRRNVLTGLLAADPGLMNVSYDMGEAN